MPPHKGLRPGAGHILVAALVLAGAAGIAAWAITGDHGIEERFSAVLDVDEGGHDHASAGPIEGDPRLLLAGLAVLGGAALVLYWRHPL